MMKTEIQDSTAALRVFEKWRQDVGVSRTTGWRWRRRRWIETLNISGKVYVTEHEVRRFTERVEAGDFATEARVPRTRREQPVVKGGRP
jgi:predicted site-specific integrase-resolvase